MEIAFTILLSIYIIFLILVWRTWARIPTHIPANNDSEYPGVSIVIPLRNEARNIPNLIDSLDGVRYPRERIEVILVDDASDDQTIELIRAHTFNKPRFRLIRLEQDNYQGSHKKRALTRGIEQAIHPVIVTTDGDCQFHKLWLLSLITSFQKNQLVMATGPVSYYSDGWWSSWMNIELAGLVAVGAASLHMGHPNMCNGANLIFTKKAFERVKGYAGFEQVISGDDEFLLYKIYKEYPERVAFVKAAQAVVDTEPPGSLSEFISQRRRWAGKSKAHKSWTTRTLAGFVLLFHLSFTLVLILAFAGRYSWEILLAQVVLKLGVEYVSTRPVLNLMDKRVALWWFCFMQLLYSFYVILIGIVAQGSSFKWKNRKYNDRSRV